MKQKWDYKNSLDFAEQKGIEKGIEKGMEQQAMKDARILKALGVADGIISQATGLSEEQVRAAHAEIITAQGFEGMTAVVPPK